MNIKQLAKESGMNTQYIEYFGLQLLEQFAERVLMEHVVLGNVSVKGTTITLTCRSGKKVFATFATERHAHEAYEEITNEQTTLS